MDDIREERLTAAFESIAQSLVKLATLSENRFDKEYPARKVPQDVTLTRIPNEEDRIREDQGASDESIEEWIGIREKAVIEKGQTRPRPR